MYNYEVRDRITNALIAIHTFENEPSEERKQELNNMYLHSDQIQELNNGEE